MRHSLILAALISLPLAAVAAQTPQLPREAPGKPLPKRAVSGRYKVDPAHTQVLFRVNHLGFSEYTGQFTQPNGTLVLDAKRPSRSRVEVRFPIAAVKTTDPELDKHLQAADFFDAKRFPEGRFVSTMIQASGTRAMISGNLTLHGVTRPVVLNTRLVGAGPGFPDGKPNIGFVAQTTVKRSDFGISSGIPLVSDQVDLTINAAFMEE